MDDSNDQKELEDLILITLSFFEPLTLSNIILDFAADKLLKFPKFNKEELQLILTKLEKKKLVKKMILDKEIAWIKMQKKPNIWRRLKHYFLNNIMK